MASYEKFDALCTKKGVTPYRVSIDNPKISTATLTSWKKGRYTPKTDKLKILADYFGVTVDYFLEE